MNIFQKIRIALRRWKDVKAATEEILRGIDILVKRLTEIERQIDELRPAIKVAEELASIAKDTKEAAEKAAKGEAVKE